MRIQHMHIEFAIFAKSNVCHCLPQIYFHWLLPAKKKHWCRDTNTNWIMYVFAYKTNPEIRQRRIVRPTPKMPRTVIQNILNWVEKQYVYETKFKHMRFANVDRHCGVIVPNGYFSVNHTKVHRTHWHEFIVVLGVYLRLELWLSFCIQILFFVCGLITRHRERDSI